VPELPEVETVKLGLQPVMEGRRFTSVQTRRGDLRVPFPNDFAARLTGRRVVKLHRRAKYILGDLDSGETLVIHLGMSGRMLVHTEQTRKKLGNYGRHNGAMLTDADKHDHVVMETDAPARIVFNDQRRFGLMLLVETAELDEHKLFKGLGIEPLGDAFDAGFLLEALKGKKTPIKSALLDQRVIAGLGNIYVCEALFRARISPKRQAIKVRPDQIGLLAPAIKSILREALKAGGSSLRDHKRTDGEIGMFQHSFKVYDREGEPCPACKKKIKRLVQAGRSSFYCPSCQK